MKPTQRLYDLGQNLWLGNIAPDRLSSGASVIRDEQPRPIQAF
jgi:hypothetical protein